MKEFIQDYFITEDGKVYSSKSRRYLKPQLNSKGYCRVHIRGKNLLIHRLVAQAFIPNKEDSPQVNHIDGNKLNNHYSNLEWCTNSYNQKHGRDLGLIKPNYGESNHSKLTEAQVLEIKSKYVRGSKNHNAYILSKEYGVSAQTIYEIIRGTKWKYLV